MTGALDEIIRVGAVTVAALVQHSVRGSSAPSVLVYGTKRPVAVLLHHHDVTVAFDVNGAWIALEDFEERFPGRRAEFERLAMAEALASPTT